MKVKTYIRDSKIDWEYHIHTSTNSKKHLPKRPWSTSLWSSAEGGKKKSALKRSGRIQKKKAPSSRDFSGIYYGVLFACLFGFLFFLTISMSQAASVNGKSQLNESLLGPEDTSDALLEEYLFSEEKDEQEDRSSEKAVLPRKIDYTKYKIQKNDTLERVAKKFHIKMDTLMLVNQISKNEYLKYGKNLLVPNQDGRLVKVKKNDSIFKIAQRYGVSWKNIVDVNNLSSSVIFAGMNLFIPGASMTEYERDRFYGVEFIWPVRGKITSGFGSRIDPFTKIYSFHAGIDIRSNSGVKVKSIQKGTVVFTGWQKVYGNFVMVKHSNNTMSTYAHLSKIDVVKGQSLKQGDILGRVGSTGRSTGPHLHLEIRKNGKLVNPLDCL